MAVVAVDTVAPPGESQNEFLAFKLRLLLLYLLPWKIIFLPHLRILEDLNAKFGFVMFTEVLLALDKLTVSYEWSGFIR